MEYVEETIWLEVENGAGFLPPIVHHTVNWLWCPNDCLHLENYPISGQQSANILVNRLSTKNTAKSCERIWRSKDQWKAWSNIDIDEKPWSPQKLPTYIILKIYLSAGHLLYVPIINSFFIQRV